MKFLYILLVLFFFSCEEPLTPEEIEAEAEASDTRPQITMEMSDDLTLSIGVSKMQQTIAIMSFEVIFDPIALKYISFSSSSFGTPFTDADFVNENNNDTHSAFAFLSDISGTGDLLTLKFQSNSVSDMKGTTVWLRNIEMFDGDIMEFDDPELRIERICYINGYESIEKGEKTWNEYADFIWSNKYCSVDYEVSP